MTENAIDPPQGQTMVRMGVTWFDGWTADVGRRVVYKNLRSFYQGLRWDDGLVRFALYRSDDRRRILDAEAGDTVRILIISRVGVPPELRRRLGTQHAYAVLSSGYVAVPVPAAKYNAAFRLAQATARDQHRMFEVPLPDDLGVGGHDIFDPDGPRLFPAFQAKEVWVESDEAVADFSMLSEIAGLQSPSTAPRAQRPAPPLPMAARASTAQSVQAQTVLPSPPARRTTSDCLEDEGEPALWCPMLPSVAITPLAVILAGRATLHGQSVRSDDNEELARFEGDRELFQALAGATTHRIIRHVLQFQQTRNHGEIVGGEVELARACGVHNGRAARSLSALGQLTIEGKPLLRVVRARRGRAHVLRFELLGVLASGYFAAGRVEQSAKGRRLTPVPLSPPPVSSRDTAAAELSLHLLLLEHLRECGRSYRDGVRVELAPRELEQFDRLVGMPAGRTLDLLLSEMWEPAIFRTKVDEHTVEVIVDKHDAPGVYEKLAEPP